MSTVQGPTTTAIPQHNLYRILNIPQTASADEVKKAIIQGSRLWSNRTNAPQIERRQEAERMVKVLDQAEAILLDAAKRAAYDRQLVSAPAEEREIDESDLTGKADLVEEARRLLSEGEIPDALFVAEKATQKDGTNPEAWAVLAQAKFRWGDIEDAIYEYKRTIKLRPNEASYYFDLGSVYESAERPGDALKQYQRAAQIDPATTMYRAAVGAVLVKNDEYAQGIQILEQCRQEEPENPIYQWFLAIAYDASATLGWTHIGEDHPILDAGWYATDYKHITDAQASVDKALALKFDDPELMADIQKDRQLIDQNLKRHFTCNWWVVGIVAVIGLFFSGIPTVVAVLYAVSAFTPQYKINERLVRGKQFNEFAFLGPLDKLGWVGGWIIMILTILIMPIVVIVNFIRNWIVK